MYEGNVDFDREKKNLSFLKTVGKDLTGTSNPYLEKDIKFSNLQQIRERLMEVCSVKYGLTGLDELRKLFSEMDRNGNGTVEPVEFKYCMRVWGAEFTEEEITQIVKHFDTNKDGKISFDEFIGMIQRWG
jgi:Ca2+-binding EF-hand superfamily protein